MRTRTPPAPPPLKENLSEENRKFLQGGCSGRLGKSASHTCSVVTIKRDCVLKNLRVLAARVDACDK